MYMKTNCKKSFRPLLMSGMALAGVAALAAQGAPGMAVMTDGTRTSVATGGGIIEITSLNDNIFRVTGRPATAAPTETPSQAVVMQPEENGVRVSATPTEVILSSPTTQVRVDRASGRVSFLDSEGNVLLSEVLPVDNGADVKSVSFTAAPGASFYGAGERGHSLRLNGDSLVMFNRQSYGYTGSDPRISQMNITVPYVASDKGFGVLFDDYNASSLQLGDTILYSSDTPLPLSYCFINGDGSLAGTTQGYTQLTGRQPLPPFWALGYITSKYGYRTQAETLGVVDTLKRRGYPVDGVVLDLYWYGSETDMGRLEWNKEQFPDHKGMLAELKEKGVNTVIISQPYINKIGAIDNYNMLAAAGMLAKDSKGEVHDVHTWVGDAGMLDVSNPRTREWLWTRYRDLTLDGVEGWWGDLGEPEVHPLTIVHDNGQTASQYHNVYGNEWSRLLYEGFRKDFPERRLMLLMRGGTAGLQRYSVFPWSTDVSRSWGGFEPQVRIMLNAGLSGLGYMSSDLGGFAVDQKKPLDSELYLRWLQMGAFTPTFRTHAQLKPEPYHYPDIEADAKRFIKMRYEWLPYNYTLAYENASQGLPLARPLNFSGDEADRALDNIGDEYLWGDNVLVAPVMKQGARSRKVVFPSGEWICWNNPALRYAGGTTATVKAPLGQLPLFVRAGAFIPQYENEIENVTQYDPTFLTVLYFPSEEVTNYTLYDDDRLSPQALENGDYQLTRFSGVRDGDAIRVNLSAEGRGYSGMPAYRLMTLRIPGVSRKPSSVTTSADVPLPECVSEKAIRQSGWAYDAASRTVTVRMPWEYDAVSFEVR